MGSLVSAIEEWSGGDVAALSDFELASDLVEIEQGIGLLEAKFAERLARFDSRHAWSDDAGSCASWLRRQCRMSPASAAAHVRVAQCLQDLPATNAAFQAGEIGFEHVRAITEATSGIDRDDVLADEPLLVDSARRLDAKAFATVCADWRHRADAARCVDDANHAFEQRRLRITQPDLGAIGSIEGRLDSEGIATVACAVEAFAAPLPGDTRTAAQRRADALVEVCRRVLDGGAAPETGGERPHVTVNVPLESLEARAGVDAARLDWSGPIPGETARRLACDAAVTRIITNGASEPLDVGRRTRTIPPALRRAVIARDRHCVEPGCDCPPEWCDVHHIVHWIDGGETKLSNLELRCHPHHRKVHEGATDAGRAPP